MLSGVGGSKRAKRLCLPAYVIFNDRTLHELSVEAPSHRVDLLGIHGMGVERFGDEILEIIAAARHGYRTESDGFDTKD